MSLLLTVYLRYKRQDDANPSSGEVSHRSARQRLRISMNEHSEAAGHGAAEPPVGGVTRRPTPTQVHAAVSAWCAG